MTPIDQAVIKAFRRQEHVSSEIKPAVSTPRDVNTPRELFVHAPEALLRGLHHAPQAEARSRREPQPAAVPHVEMEQQRSSFEPATIASESLRPAWETDAFRTTEMCQAIRTRLHEQIQRSAADLLHDAVRGRLVVCVTGLTRGEGRTTVATLLAHALVALGRSVILVDADQTNPSLSAHLGVASDSGWHAGLCELSEIAECCVHSIADRFSILPLDPAHCTPNGSLLGEMSQLLTLLADQFDVVLVDVGVVGADAANWPQAMTSSYVVVRDARRNDELALEQLIARLAPAGRPPVRVVENFAGHQV
jgi:Mrp family chromosome partitioning ATPase